MKENEVPNQIKPSDMWLIAIIVTLAVLVLVVFVTTACWDELCAKIVITGLEHGLKQGLGIK